MTFMHIKADPMMIMHIEEEMPCMKDVLLAPRSAPSCDDSDFIAEIYNNGTALQMNKKKSHCR